MDEHVNKALKYNARNAMDMCCAIMNETENDYISKKYVLEKLENAQCYLNVIKSLCEEE